MTTTTLPLHPRVRHYLLPLIYCLLFAGTSLFAQRSVTVEDGFAGLDIEDDFLLIYRSPSLQSALSTPAGILRYRGVNYTLNSPLSTPATDQTYAATAAGRAYQIAFTDLPLTLITFEEELTEDGRSRAALTYASADSTVSSPVGIRYRGGFSNRFPKRSYDLEFREVEDYSETTNFRIGDLRNDDDWVLDALYNEPMRVNSYVAHRLWLELHRPYYQAEERGAESGAGIEYTEVFIGNRYEGLYAYIEQIDRKQLNLRRYDDETSTLRGELYQGEEWTGSTLFTQQAAPPPNDDDDYDGWEVKYPDFDEGNPLDNLYDLIGFVVNSDDATFRAQAADRVLIDNMIDYELFVNALSLPDNVGKNTFLGRFDAGEPYFYLPWDLDASFGNNFDGENLDPNATDWYTNGLLERLEELSPDRYQTRRCDRYNNLRRTLFNPENLLDRLSDARSLLGDNGALMREASRWPGSVDVSDAQLAFTRTYVTRRLEFLDEEVCARATSTTSPPAAAPAFTLYPNPAHGYLTVEREVGTAQAYQLLTLDGRSVAAGTLNGRRTTITLDRLPAGAYLLQVGGASRRVNVR